MAQRARSRRQFARPVLLVDTSQSMGLHDADASPVPAEPSRAQQVQAALRETRFLDDLRRKHDVQITRFDQDAARVAALDKLPPAPDQDATATADRPATTARISNGISCSPPAAPRRGWARLSIKRLSKSARAPSRA